MISDEQLVSVIVPVYAVEDYLDRCVESILMQTHPQLEIILIDDGSPDRCGAMCDGYAARDARVRVIHQENGGLSAARNAGLRISTGTFVAFVDSDDFIDRDMIRTMVEKATQTDCDIVECSLHHTFADREDTESVPQYRDRKTLLCLGRCIVWNKLYRRALLRRADAKFPEGMYYEDVAFYACLIPHISGYEYVDIAPYHYVQRPESINNYSTHRTRQIFPVLRGILAYYRAHGFYAEFEEALEFYCARILLCSSFARMCRIPQRGIRHAALRENWAALRSLFPGWRKNPLLRAWRGRHALFMRTVNALTYRVYSILLPPLLRRGVRP